MREVVRWWTDEANRSKRYAAIVYLSCAAQLLLLDRVGLQRSFTDVFPIWTSGLNPSDIRFYAQFYFVACFTILFILIPLGLYLKWGREVDHSWGLQLPTSRSHVMPYVVMAAIMVPVIALVSRSPGFNRFYPMYSPTHWEDWLIFEGIYMAQFIAVELYFRGYLIFSLEGLFGRFAIILSVLPYAMIHIHKPLPEALGSIVAGVILGYFGIKGRSVWPGVFLHCFIALSTDIFCLYYSGRLWSLWS